MDPELYHALRGKIQSPDNTATRITIPEGTGPTTLKNRIPRVAAELGMPVTIRRVAGSLLFWRSIDENLQQAREIPQRLQTALSKGRSPPGRRRRA
jgi:D-alanine-D-alanine ligase-like ATP-grasp enzyme